MAKRKSASAASVPREATQRQWEAKVKQLHEASKPGEIKRHWRDLQAIEARSPKLRARLGLADKPVPAATKLQMASTAAVGLTGTMDLYRTFRDRGHSAFGSAFGAATVGIGTTVIAHKLGVGATPLRVALGALEGAAEDRDSWGGIARGALRGAVRQLDPTTIATNLMSDRRGIAERTIDHYLGSAPRARNGLQRAAEIAPPQPTKTAAAPAYKDTWTDTRGITYQRRDLSVRRA